MKKVKREAAAQRPGRKQAEKPRFFSAKRQAVWFETQRVSNGKCSGELRDVRLPFAWTPHDGKGMPAFPQNEQPARRDATNRLLWPKAFLGENVQDSRSGHAFLQP
ncbi:hypothetical protein [uncultured Desulfovibrio sp.]|uniref:hypothetical protein n=1 Tax=uncultured Desulfovibrio sp. TaxID=167968 RepID=UPI00260BC142|nr:hypothetical protein [uncultured Desulfovibrio sp.]